MKKTIYLLAITTLIFSACSNDNNQTENDHDHTSQDHSSNEHEERTIEGTTEKSAATSEIIESYIQLKNALVEDNSKKAAIAGEMMLDAFSKFDMTKLTENQHEEYMDIAEDAKEHAEHIIKSPIDHQREHFEILSIDIIGVMLKIMGSSLS